MPRSVRQATHPMLATMAPAVLAIASSTVVAALHTQDEHEAMVQSSRFFESQAWPIIERSCLPCHGGEDRIRGGFRIDARQGLVRGGDRGPAIDEEALERSLILEMISWKSDDYQMPPEGRLPDEEIAILTEWVLEGATWADGVGSDLPAEAFESQPIPDGGDWWAWQPLGDPSIPTVQDQAWVTNPIDAFILARLEAAGISPAPEADRPTLIKRVAYDVTGLPPTPEEIEAFVADTRPDAYERMVDRYLQSPQHGVKWARHWLDAVRYADTDGYERDRTKPEAWRYRDWVVDAINQDKPWNRFLIEQLAGDELPDRDLETLTATGFYRLGIWDDEPTDVELAKNDDMDSIIDVVSRGMMGMSIACARCHEHKRDPILQGDYYRLAAIFRDLKPYKERMGNAIDANNITRRVPDHFGKKGEAEFAEARRRYEQGFETVMAELRERSDAVRPDPDSSPSVSGIIAHYPLDDTDKGPLFDATGRHPGNLLDARFGRSGLEGGALGFDGGDDRAMIPNVARDSFTISLWLKTTSQARGSDGDPRWFLGSGIVDGEVSGIVDDYGISMIGSGIVAAGVGNPETFINSPPGYNDGEWHHLAFTRDAKTGRIALFMDGREVDSATGGKQTLDAIERLSVGRMLPGNGGFNGTLDEILIHERALDAEEIAAMASRIRIDDAVVEAIRSLEGEAAAAEFIDLRNRMLSMQPPSAATTLVLCARGHGPVPPSTNILIRGDAHSPGRPVEPGVPMVLGGTDFATAPPSHGESSGLRLAFADWLVEEENRVTWRVAANRLWQHLFGRGIVRSSDDFGSLGSRPTHPELLDWLAREFGNQDGSRREMARLVLESSTYRMSNRFDEDAYLADPLNDLSWRRDLRRLSAEELRDSILAMSGQLNPELQGPGVYPPLPKAVLETASRPDQAWGRANDAQAGRRSLYVFLKRSLRHPFLEGFDQPDTDRPCSVRFATTVPTQSLMMMNSEFMDRQAARFASRLRSERPNDLRAQIERGLQLVLCRRPSDEEIDAIARLIAELEAEDGLDPSEALEASCVLMLNLNEFLHVG